MQYTTRGTALAVAAVAALFVTSARADFITAYGWSTTEAIVNSATGATAGSLALATCHNGAGACTTANADVTFTTTGVNFSAAGANVATWLASSTFTLDNLVDNIPNNLMDPTIWLFVGNVSVTSPDPFTIAHDDGATFIVNGQTVVNAPGPTSPATTSGTYTGPADGNAPFELIYTECCGGPAVLQVSLLAPQNAPVPEPGSVILFSAALLGVVALRRKSGQPA
jgi:PEP-CTERM motif